MIMLYLLNKQTGKSGIEFTRLDANAILVLIEDGCYLNLNLNTVKDSVKIYALREHMTQRGLLEKMGKVQLITYDELVDLIANHPVANFG
jgi:sulfur relay protein TusB/DsrH